MKILDLSAGNRAVWFNKNHTGTVYVDRRESVKPTLVADTRQLPFRDGSFDLVVFDPPHKNNAASGNMSYNYGHCTAAEIRDIVRGTAKEAHRITYIHGLMAFKWNEHSRTLSDIMDLMRAYWEPLFGHGVTHQQRGTAWVMLLRRRGPIIDRVLA